MNKQQQLENLRIALWRWESIPEENVYPSLNHFNMVENTTEPECGTVACFGGWVALMPEFRQMGVRVGAAGAPTYKNIPDAYRVAEMLFGDFNLFRTRGIHTAFHPADSGFEGTDHALVTNRIKHAIRALEGASHV